jgi:hypothetical protein
LNLGDKYTASRRIYCLSSYLICSNFSEILNPDGNISDIFHGRTSAMIKKAIVRRRFLSRLAAAMLLQPFNLFAQDAKKGKPVIKARHVICVLGEWRNLSAVSSLVESFGQGFTFDAEFSKTSPDKRMTRAFDVSADRVDPSMTEADLKAIAGHKSVVYVLSPPVDREKSLIIARQTLELIAKLFAAGATAIKNESPGLAHGKARWLALIERAKITARAGASDDAMQALIEATVRRPISAENLLYSCGAHLFGLRDIETVGVKNERDAVKLMDRLIAMQLKAGYAAATPTSIESDSKKLLPVTTSNSEHYESDSFLYNPFGYLSVKAN